MLNSVSYPNQTRNYCVFDESRLKTNLDEIKTSLENPKSEDEVLENLYALNLMLDEGNKDVASLYPTLSKYNNTKSPNIQTFLAGIYRKTKIPDAFGPLCVMLIQNAINPPKDCPFDPNEEIGGAILDYLA
ncbi:MAG: hypothetical protein NC408_04160 [Candidatus Gastranaerophilales bacterium]|nr:hypothetical protein [Candidatus Gastranaerophilales bacterium]MCM1073749.1 hypothetical protein [Bacteroides sp.]